MDIISFVADLLTKPTSNLNSLISKTLKILLLFLVSHSMWVLMGGNVTIPKELSFNFIWLFFSSGQVLIPIMLVYFTSKILNFMIIFILPLVVMILSVLIDRVVRRLFYIVFDNKPVKVILRFLKSIGLIKVRSNKIKKGIFYRAFKLYFSNTDMSKLSKEHILSFELFVQILIVWTCLVKFEDFPSVYLYKFIGWSLIALLIYIPLNLSTLNVTRNYSDRVNEIIQEIEKINSQTDNQNI